jgi:hypothetical protein
MRVSNDENAVFVSGTLGGAPELSHSLYGEDFYSAELLCRGSAVLWITSR